MCAQSFGGIDVVGRQRTGGDPRMSVGWHSWLFEVLALRSIGTIDGVFFISDSVLARMAVDVDCI